MTNREPIHAEHGGASFDAIGADFSTLTRRHAVIDADVLDAWYEPAPAVLDTLRGELAWLVKTSPPTHGDGLRATLAARHALAPQQVLVSGGTSNLMYLALPRLVAPGERVALLDPMYGEYRHLLERLLGAQVVTCDLDEEHDFQPDPVRIAQAAAGCKLLVMVNPNSPTGAVLGRAGLAELLARLDPDVRVWIDETYIDFVPDVPSAESLVAREPRLVIAKSMSKFFALSGLRVGYLVAEASLIGALEPWNPPWSAGLLAQVAAVRALGAYDWYRDRATDTSILREELRRALDAIPGLHTLPSTTNFLLVRTTHTSAATLVARCRAQDVYLRDCDSLGQRFGGRYLRTAVKDHRANERIVAALRAAVFTDAG